MLAAAKSACKRAPRAMRQCAVNVSRGGASIERRGSRKTRQISRFFAQQTENWRAIGIVLRIGVAFQPRRVAGKAGDVTAIDEDPMLAPGEQLGAIVCDLVGAAPRGSLSICT